jgi:CBS domain containing-hemolysin-like protein
MIRRPDIVALDVTLPVDRLLDRVAATIHTRLPVYEDSIDNVIGMLHVPELFRHIRGGAEPLEVRRLLRPPLLVPGTLSLEELLERFRQHHTQIAVVLGEHGETAGLLTLEDVVEEVFGELQDALEAEQPSIHTAPDGRVLVRGDVRLDEVQERVGWVLDETEAETIAGYVMDRLRRPARPGDVVETRSGTIRVENTARHRITQVALEPGKARADA